MSWPPEEIPDDATLYMRIHRQYIKPDGSLRSGCFQNRPDDRGGMSTDWDRYATPQETRERARRPHDNAVVALHAGQVRTIPDQEIRHSPVHNHPELPDNRAHTDVYGPKEQDPEVRRRFQRIARFVLPLADDA